MHSKSYHTAHPCRCVVVALNLWLCMRACCLEQACGAGSVLLLSVRLGSWASLRACPCPCDNRLQRALPESSVAVKLRSLNSTRAICEQLELAGCWKGTARVQAKAVKEPAWLTTVPLATYESKASALATRTCDRSQARPSRPLAHRGHHILVLVRRVG